MDENNREEFIKGLEEFERENQKDGIRFRQFERNSLFRIYTPLGTLYYWVDLNSVFTLIKKVLSEYALIESKTFSESCEVGELIKIFNEIKLNPPKWSIEESTDESEPSVLADSATRYIASNVNAMFTEAVEKCVLESILQAVTSSNSKSDELSKIKPKALDHLAAYFNKLSKLRFYPSVTNGKKINWTRENLLELLSVYEEALSIVKDAKKLFNTFKKNTEWRKIIKVAYSQLSDEVIEQIRFPGKESEASVIAIRVAAESFGIISNDYTKKLLTKARKIRKEQK